MGIKRYINRLIVLIIFTISYATMGIIDVPMIGLLIIPTYLICLTLVTPETLVCLFIGLMFFTYPYVNAGIALVLFLIIIIRNQKVRLGNSKIMICIYILIFWEVICALVSENPAASINEFITWSYIILLYLICINVNIEHSKNRVLKSFVYGGTVLSVLYFVNFIIPNANILMTNSNIVRLPGTNYSAIIMTALLPIIYYLKTEKYLNRMMGIFLEILYILGILSTGSRGAISILGIYYLAIFIMQGIVWKRISTKVFLTGIVVVASISVIIITVPSIQAILMTLNSVFSIDNYSNIVRINLYEDIFERILPHNYICGIGPGNFQSVYFINASISFDANHAHSLYLQYLVEEGFVGLGLLLCLLFIAFKKIGKSIKRKATITWAVRWILVGYMVYGTVEYVWGDSRSLGLLIIMLIICERNNLYHVEIDVHNKQSANCKKCC